MSTSRNENTMTSEKLLFPTSGAAFVAGGSGGIGSAICKRLAQSGTPVVLTYKTNEAKARAVVEEIEAEGGRATAIPLALEDANAVKSAVDAAAQTEGGIHTVIYATGPFVHFRFVSKMTPAEMQEYLNVDTMACFNLMHAALPYIRAAKGSALAITTCAIDRWANQDGLSAIPKAAVNAIMHGIAKEEGRFGVRANMVALGVIDAGMFNRAKDEGRPNPSGGWGLEHLSRSTQRLGAAFDNQQVRIGSVFSQRFGGLVVG